MAMEEMDRMALMVVDEDDLPPGGSETSEMTFSRAYGEGEIELACHVLGHYETGMRLPIQVN